MLWDVSYPNLGNIWILSMYGCLVYNLYVFQHRLYLLADTKISMADIHGNPIRNIVAIMPGHCVSCPAREGNGGHNMYRQFFAALTSGPMERLEARNNIIEWATNMDLETSLSHLLQ